MISPQCSMGTLGRNKVLRLPGYNLVLCTGWPLDWLHRMLSLRLLGRSENRLGGERFRYRRQRNTERFAYCFNVMNGEVLELLGREIFLNIHFVFRGQNYSSDSSTLGS